MPFVDPAAWDLIHVAARANPPQPNSPKTRVRAVRVHLPDRDLDTTRVRGVGFRATASDGWRGPIRKSYVEAREDAHAHRAGET